MSTALKIGDHAPEALLLDQDGSQKALQDFWQDGPVLLAFLRHFGCIFCREWLTQLQQQHEALDAAGLKIVAVGIGEPKHAERVCGRKAPNLVCLTDASTTTHELYGVRRMGAGSMKWGPVLAAGVKAVLHGNIQAQATGDQKMLSAAFIVDQTGTVRYTYYSQHAADLPTLETLIGAATSLQVN